MTDKQIQARVLREGYLALREKYNKKWEANQVAFQKRTAALKADLESAKAAMIATCDHPLDHRTKFNWESNNGFGSVNRFTGERCQLCGGENKWGSDGSWRTVAQQDEDRAAHARYLSQYE